MVAKCELLTEGSNCSEEVKLASVAQPPIYEISVTVVNKFIKGG